MAEQKTKPTNVSVDGYLNEIADEQQREDAFAVLALMKKVTGLKPRMWGPSIIGFGEYHYKYASGHEGDCCLIGFSPRKGNLSLYFLPGVERFAAQLKKLGKHKTGKGCLYFSKLADVDEAVLREIIKTGYGEMCKPAQQNKRAEPTTKSRSKS